MKVYTILNGRKLELKKKVSRVDFKMLGKDCVKLDEYSYCDKESNTRPVSLKCHRDGKCYVQEGIFEHINRIHHMRVNNESICNVLTSDELIVEVKAMGRKVAFKLIPTYESFKTLSIILNNTYNKNEVSFDLWGNEIVIYNHQSRKEVSIQIDTRFKGYEGVSTMTAMCRGNKYGSRL